MIRYMLQQAAIAPIQMKINPSAIPQSAKTYGKDNTPDPIADAHKANILPRKLPLSSFENVLFQ